MYNDFKLISSYKVPLKIWFQVINHMHEKKNLDMWRYSVNFETDQKVQMHFTWFLAYMADSDHPLSERF